jgi:conserved oligomeric Golgi complex subunit 4
VEQLFNQLVRPKLRTFLADVYKDYTYVLDDDSYAAAEYNEVVKKRFIKNIDLIVTGYKVRTYTIRTVVLISPMYFQEMFTENNFALFFVLLLDTLIKPWEKQIMTFRYNEVHGVLIAFHIVATHLIRCSWVPSA